MAKITVMNHRDAVKSCHADRTSERMRDAEREVRRVGHGEVIIRVESGNVVQIDTVKKQRYERGG